MGWWPWRRCRSTFAWEPPHRIPDGDSVLVPGQRRWTDLLRESSWTEARAEADPRSLRRGWRAKP
jgi:hypothetical protein